MSLTTTPAVDAIAGIVGRDEQFDRNWSRHLLTRTGQPYWPAIILLGHIRRWYRPWLERDPGAPGGIRAEKKFAGDRLYLTLPHVAQLLNCHVNTARRVLRYLEELGLIEISHEERAGANFRQVSSIFVEPIPAALSWITYESAPLPRPLREPSAQVELPLDGQLQSPDAASEADTPIVPPPGHPGHGRGSLPRMVGTPYHAWRGDPTTHGSPHDPMSTSMHACKSPPRIPNLGEGGSIMESRESEENRDSRGARAARSETVDSVSGWKGGEVAKGHGQSELGKRLLGMDLSLAPKAPVPAPKKKPGAKRPVSTKPRDTGKKRVRPTQKEREAGLFDRTSDLLQTWRDWYRHSKLLSGQPAGPPEWNAPDGPDPEYAQKDRVWRGMIVRLLKERVPPPTIETAIVHAFRDLFYPPDWPWPWRKKFWLIVERRAAVWGYLDYQNSDAKRELDREREEAAREIAATEAETIRQMGDDWNIVDWLMKDD